MRLARVRCLCAVVVLAGCNSPAEKPPRQATNAIGEKAVSNGQSLTLSDKANNDGTGSSIQDSLVVRTITKPVVNQRITEYRDITFEPGDMVTIEAGGCVQTGGSGKTWKRYVDPQGPNSDRLYHGLLWIPGINGGLQRLEGMVGRTYSIPQHIPKELLFLRLGYEDDNYGDNGYQDRNGDDGTGDQCRGLGDAWVRLTVSAAPPTSSGSPPPPPAPLDVVTAATDANYIPLNPKWGFQVTHPGELPNAKSITNNLPMRDVNRPVLGVALGEVPWTTQSPSVDVPTGFNSVVCFTGAPTKSFRGHLNWTPATYEGIIFWDEHKDFGHLGDDDYNMYLRRKDRAGYTIDNTVNRNGLLVEFDSDETIDHFDTPWWNQFHSAVDKSKDDARRLVDGKLAIVTGLLGLDCEHEDYAELHPAWMVAIRIEQTAKIEKWAFFLRNWGNEGFCSQDQHYLDLDHNRFIIRLPWRLGATSGKLNPAASQIRSNSSQIIGPSVFFRKESLAVWDASGVEITFILPSPESRGRVHGEIVIEWEGELEDEVLPDGLDSGREIADDEEHGDAEEHLREIFTSMTPDQKNVFHAAIGPTLDSLKTKDKSVPGGFRRGALAIVFPNDPELKSNFPEISWENNLDEFVFPNRLGKPFIRPGTTFGREFFGRGRSFSPPQFRAVFDGEKSKKDQLRFDALMKAFDGKIPGLELKTESEK